MVAVATKPKSNGTKVYDLALLGIGGYAVYKNRTKITNAVVPLKPSASPSTKGLAWYGSDGAWASWAANAEIWFKKMGYDAAWLGASVTSNGMGTYIPIGSNPADKKTVLADVAVVPNIYYHLAHGDWLAVQSAAKEWIYARDWRTAIPPSKGLFAFIGSCGAFDEPDPVQSLGGTLTVPNAFLQAYRCVIGYTKIPEMSDWNTSLPWQEKLFSALSQGMTVAQAKTSADESIPEMIGHIKIAGDAQVRLVGSQLLT